jgi:hypothetical protein
VPGSVCFGSDIEAAGVTILAQALCPLDVANGGFAAAKATSQLAERNESACRLVPEHEANACKTLAHGDPADILESGTVAQSKGQPVEWNSAAEVVDVVHADIGGEPAQHDRQIVM